MDFSQVLNCHRRPTIPQNWKIIGTMNPDYECGSPVQVSPSQFPDPSGLLSETASVATWQLGVGVQGSLFLTALNRALNIGPHPFAVTGFEEVYTFNGSVLQGSNSTIFMQGRPGLNYLLAETDGSNSIIGYLVHEEVYMGHSSGNRGCVSDQNIVQLRGMCTSHYTS
ncbi:hypothetical protein V6N13_146779 [Hibiscus sabdariffa]